MQKLVQDNRESFSSLFVKEDLNKLSQYVDLAAIIEETGATGMGDIGKVMPVVMQRGAGSIDGKTANVILRELLG